MAKAGIPIAAVTSPGTQMGDALTVSGTSSPRPHLDGPVECWPPPAQHEQTQDGDAIAEVVDEGHVVDERVRVSHKHDDRRGPALGEDWAEGWPSTCLRSALPAQARRLLSPGPAHPTVGGPPGPGLIPAITHTAGELSSPPCQPGSHNLHRQGGRG